MISRGSLLRGIASTLSLLVLGLAMMTARVIYDGQHWMGLSDEAFDSGNLRLATRHARRAATAYAPGAPHVSQAYARLYAVARGSEATGNQEMAKLAWRAVRGAALESRHLWVPRAHDLERANSALARLQAQAAARDAGDPQKAHALARRELDQIRAPRTTWTLLLGVGFLACFVGMLWVALRGVTRRGELILSQAKLGALLALLGAACWTIAALKA